LDPQWDRFLADKPALSKVSCAKTIRQTLCLQALKQPYSPEGTEKGGFLWKEMNWKVRLQPGLKNRVLQEGADMGECKNP